MNKGKIHEEWEEYLTLADAYIDEFDPDGTPYSCESEYFKSPNTLKFSSKKNTDAFGDNEAEVETDTGTGVVMGFDDEKTVLGEVTLDEVLKTFGVEPPKNNSLKKIFKILEGLGVIEIDVARPGNGFWILPKVVEPEEEPDEEEEKEGGEKSQRTEDDKKTGSEVKTNDANKTVLSKDEKSKDEGEPKKVDAKVVETDPRSLQASHSHE